ncbi:MAG TPA: peptide chain release factor N(5)-glutamine methyltransferase [Gemmatimonadales bacterium]|nr:peptide chain release factor N(5)-glutamine methyltransferase [Gemmatimonadales bacterium]
MTELSGSLTGLLAEARKILGTAGIPEPAREALLLWADMSDEPAAGVLLASSRTLDPDLAAAFLGAVERRARGEPLSYVTGWTGFRLLKLRIDRRALIPRPETEGLVELLLERVGGGRVADVGTGSGCIALSLATEGRYDRVIAIDRSPAALALAAVNRELVGAPVTLVRGDLTAPLRSRSLDGLVSNPPYLTATEYRDLDTSVAGWEPRDALVSGDDGLDATIRLLHDGSRVLRSGGWIALELDVNRAATVAELARTREWEAVEVRADLFGRERYLLARRSKST